MNVVEFLEARIAEDEAAARESQYYEQNVYEAEGWFDCTRVLAECKAKREIIRQHQQWPVLVQRHSPMDYGNYEPQSMVMRVSQEIAWLTEQEYVKRFGDAAPTAPMIRTLAAVYADHPDYQEEWRHA